MCDFASHAATLSVHSVWLSCNSRTGSAEGTQRGDASRRRWVARRDERLCIISDSVGYLLYPCRAPHILNVLYWAPVVTVFWKGSKLASPRQVLYSITILRYDMTVMNCRLWNESMILFPSVLVTFAAVISDSADRYLPWPHWHWPHSFPIQ
jgi:hypothetical protein